MFKVELYIDDVWVKTYFIKSDDAESAENIVLDNLDLQLSTEEYD